jgi:sulfide:quinone oxidoreductase
VGVTSQPFKCPPAPSEAVLLLHDFLVANGVRENCNISLVMPFGVPIPPSPETSQALLTAFAERGITFVPNHSVQSLDPVRRVVVLNDLTEMPYDLFLGVPVHRVPEVIATSGMTDNGWIPVDKKNLNTRFPGVYAIGDVTSVGTPKAGVFSEAAARIVAESIIAELEGGDYPAAYAGAGSCYVEFGHGNVGRVDVDFLTGPKPTGTFQEPSVALVAEKQHFGSSRSARWFGL